MKQHKRVLSKACNATRDAAIHLLESTGFSVSADARRVLHRYMLVFIGDGSFATRGWAKGHRASPVKQVQSRRLLFHSILSFFFGMKTIRLFLVSNSISR